MPQITLGQALKKARDQYNAGQFSLAKTVCEKILAEKPEQPDALCLLGYLTSVRDRDQGLAMMRRAVQISPANAEFHYNLGCVLYGGKQFDEAIAHWHRATSLRPDRPEAWNSLGKALVERGQGDQALAAFHRAIAARPAQAEGYQLLVSTLRSLGRVDEAIAAARKGLAACSDSRTLYNLLGVSHVEKDQLAEAADALRRAIVVGPAQATDYINLAVVLRRRGEIGEAIELSRQAAKLDPQSPDAWMILGNSLRSGHECQQAEAAYRKVIELRPDFAEAHDNLGAALRDQCRFSEAKQASHRAIALKPDLANAHWNYSLALLLEGEFTTGWVEYEWRWQRKEFTRVHRTYPQPQWYGSDPAGKTIIVHHEQGLGDTIQMSRFIPLLAARGARVILACPQELHRLMQSLVGAAEIRLESQGPDPCDFQIPMMSLPLAFETVLKTIPAPIPYLRAEPALVAAWSSRIESPGAHVRVGLVWAGHSDHIDDRKRSLSLANLAPFSRIGHARFYSLQKGPAADQATNSLSSLTFIDLASDFKDFADTAAAIENLDLIITVDTSVAHLAGALGKPCWVLLACVPDWRWLLDREDSPWYPTLRLFRQAPGQTWEAVVDRVAQELGRWGG